MRHSQNIYKIDSFLKLVLKSVLLVTFLQDEVSGLLKRVLVFYIKSIDLVEVLIFGGVGFIEVGVCIIQDSLKHLRRKLFLAISR